MKQLAPNHIKLVRALSFTVTETQLKPIQYTKGNVLAGVTMGTTTGPTAGLRQKFGCEQF